jgi:CheY-like chemotaxis protein
MSGVESDVFTLDAFLGGRWCRKIRKRISARELQNPQPTDSSSGPREGSRLLFAWIDRRAIIILTMLRGQSIQLPTGGPAMSELQGKRILVVDDERDVCEMVVEQLDQCRVDTAGTYEAAKALLSKERYDVVILDIMGVRGHDLLQEFAKVAPTIMLTAHALTPQDMKRSIQGNAVLYLPKEELSRLDGYVLKVLQRKGSLWSWLFKRLDFTKWFGEGWLEIVGDINIELDDEEVMRDLEGWR